MGSFSHGRQPQLQNIHLCGGRRPKQREGQKEEWPSLQRNLEDSKERASAENIQAWLKKQKSQGRLTRFIEEGEEQKRDEGAPQPQGIKQQIENGKLLWLRNNSESSSEVSFFTLKSKLNSSHQTRTCLSIDLTRNSWTQDVTPLRWQCLSHRASSTLMKTSPRSYLSWVKWGHPDNLLDIDLKLKDS